MIDQIPCVVAISGTRTFLEFSRWHQMTQWSHWMLLTVVCIVIVGYVSWLYRRDFVELQPGVAASLLLLRIFAFVGILLVFLGLEQRREKQLTKDSRVVLLFDTSLSMGIHDAPQANISPSSRLQQVVNGLTHSNLIRDLRRLHHVIAYHFDQGSTPSELVSLPKLVENHKISAEPLATAKQNNTAYPRVRTWFIVAMILFVSGLFLSLIYGFTSSAATTTGWQLLAAVCLLLGALAIGATTHLRYPEVQLGLLMNRNWPAQIDFSEEPLTAATESHVEPAAKFDWATNLKPAGTETRLGEALRYLVDKERGGAIAAIVIFTDGNSNAGLKPETVAQLAQSIPIPLFAVGLGSEKRPVNVRIADLQVPPRVFPGDAFTVSGFLQSSGLAGRTVSVQLLALEDNPGTDPAKSVVLDERPVRLSDDEIVSVKFEVTPSTPGRYVYQLNLAAPPEDQNAEDNRKQSIVRVVERNNQVLLIAGGPTREYRFVRNLLFRDQHMSGHVWLQTGLPGMSQEADHVIEEFPDLPDDLFSYDAILAFDIDWTQLNQHQVELLERWVAEKAGGLVLIAGTVHTPHWTSLQQDDSRWSTIRALYPVVFYRESNAAFHLSQSGSEQAWPLDFTRHGLSAEFLWLDDTAERNEQAWAAFEGVYGFFCNQTSQTWGTGIRPLF